MALTAVCTRLAHFQQTRFAINFTAAVSVLRCSCSIVPRTLYGILRFVLHLSFEAQNISETIYSLLLDGEKVVAEEPFDMENVLQWIKCFLEK